MGSSARYRRLRTTAPAPCNIVTGDGCLRKSLQVNLPPALLLGADIAWKMAACLFMPAVLLKLRYNPCCNVLWRNPLM